MKRIFLSLIFTAGVLFAKAQTLAPLTVEKIMRDPKWIGVSPMAPSWSADSKTLYFLWNPALSPGDSLYAVSLTNRIPVKVAAPVRRGLPAMSGVYNRARTKKIFEKNGDLFLMEIASGKIIRVTNTIDRESSPVFSFDEQRIYFTCQSNLFSWEISTGTFTQCSDFHKGSIRDSKTGEQEKWLKAQQRELFTVLRERADQRKASEKSSKGDKPDRPKEIYLDEKNADNVQISPDENFIFYRLSKNAAYKNTFVPSFVTESGFTEEISSRTKVGTPSPPSELMVYDIKKDTVQSVSIESLEGIGQKPLFRNDYPVRDAGDKKEKKDKKEIRAVSFSAPVWSQDGKRNVISIRSVDNKDRWLVSLDPGSRVLTLIDHQHDEAWIGGPALGGFFGNSAMGWLADHKTLWFLSEETGFSHLYLYDVSNRKKIALTSGKYEVQSVQLSADRKFFYIATNESHPGEKQFYRLPAGGGKAEKLTTLAGANDVTLSPDEKWLAIRYSYSNKPWELYLQENKIGARPQQLTQSTSAEFNSYPWRDPEVVTIPARDGGLIYTRLFKPQKPNGAAVVFVHGAGYLQNAHKWWSSYFREFMFHNLLSDQGYTVIDMDYRASSGYGRDWRTGIYRFMGGKDLTDHLDGAKWLIEKHNIDPKRIGLYGGSYGGFITLMAMFTAPDVFAAGAALRPVTDWAHYNQGYTSAILNEPVSDSLAYARSSPIYYAEGLKGALLICHGMVDTNVHFQDAVRLSQRLIELGKNNWELAVYPVEDHGFVEPSSWTDEYKRILKLFDENLKKK